MIIRCPGQKKETKQKYQGQKPYPSQGKSQYYKFHTNIGHLIENYQKLKYEIEYLVRKRVLRRFYKQPKTTTIMAFSTGLPTQSETNLKDLKFQRLVIIGCHAGGSSYNAYKGLSNRPSQAYKFYGLPLQATQKMIINSWLKCNIFIYKSMQVDPF